MKKNIEKIDDTSSFEKLYNCYMKEEKYHKAIKALKKFLSKYEYAKGYYLLGEAYCKLADQEDDDNDYEEAVEAYQKAIELDASNVQYYLKLAKVQDEIFGDSEEALANYQCAFKIQPDDKICVLIAEQYYILNEIEKSNNYYKKALEINSNNIDANIFQAHYVYENDKKPEEALKLVKMLVDQGVSLKEFKFLIGDCLMALQKYDEALKWFTYMIDNKIDIQMGYVNRARLYALVTEYSKAIEDYTTALSKGKQASYIFYERGIVYCKMKQKKFAENDLRQIKLMRANEQRINELEKEINNI